jgi:hypothetical protein
MDILQLEQAMHDALKKDQTPENAQKNITKYTMCKNKLFGSILEWIRTNEPNLTDHGPDHIDNVLNNVYKLVEVDIENGHFSGLDLYIMCMAVLFHDVGNIFSRDKHNQNIQPVIKEFDQILDVKRERQVVVKAGRAHSGKSGDDTLRELDEAFPIGGEAIKLREIAAIIRFADELAEGPQRTSAFMNNLGLFSKDSKIYHKYAECTDIHIDSKNERISLNYSVELSGYTDLPASTALNSELGAFIEYIYSRIIKLDQERKYFGYYFNSAKKIKHTSAKLTFTLNDCEVDYSPDQISLDDLVVPGGCQKSILNSEDCFDTQKMIAGLNVAINNMENVSVH